MTGMVLNGKAVCCMHMGSFDESEILLLEALNLAIKLKLEKLVKFCVLFDLWCFFAGVASAAHSSPYGWWLNMPAGVGSLCGNRGTFRAFSHLADGYVNWRRLTAEVSVKKVVLFCYPQR
uniref:Uncharacterized protein n=1 Tax=Oryza brachyantha TaxID=4533 RepID=J3M5S5_ORYBR